MLEQLADNFWLQIGIGMSLGIVWIIISSRKNPLADCPACGGTISTEAYECPHCGHPLKSTLGQIILKIFVGGFLFSLGLVILSLFL